MNIYISHAGNFDYETALYLPLKASELYRQHQLFLPHEPANVDVKTQDIIGTFDLMVGEVSYPSTGQGIELGLAAAAHVPIICFYKANTTPSSALRFYAESVIPYTDSQGLVRKLAEKVAAYKHQAS